MQMNKTPYVMKPRLNCDDAICKSPAFFGIRVIAWRLTAKLCAALLLSSHLRV